MSVPYRKRLLFPQTLGQCLEPVTRPLLKTQGLAGSRILSEWKNIVGAELAAHSIPEKLSFAPSKKVDGTLTIAVENGFALKMQHMQHVIIERLATYFGYKAVSRISISHAYLPPPVKIVAKPLPATLSKEDTAIVQSIDDDELRAALTALADCMTKKDT